MLLLDDTDMAPATFAFEPVTPRGGKRPRTTPSTSCPARQADRPDFLAAPTSKKESRIHLVHCRPEVPPADPRIVVVDEGGRSRRVVNTVSAQHVSPSQLRSICVNRAGEDLCGEAQAMAADEARPPPLTDNRKVNSAGAKKRSISVYGQRGHVTDLRDDRAQHSNRAPTDQNAVAGVAGTGWGEANSAAPAYEPSVSGGEPWLPPFQRTQDNHRPHGTADQKTKTGPHGGVPPSRAESRAEGSFDSKGRPGSDLEMVGALSPSMEENGGKAPASPGQGRETFLATVGRSQDTYHHLRQDLLRYMKDARAK